MANSLCSAEGWKGTRVCADHVRALQRSAWARRNPRAARSAVKAFCGATWTQDRAIRAGHAVEDPVCPLCGSQADSLPHRVFDCKHVDAVDARSKHRWAVARMKENVGSDPLFAFRAIWNHPAPAAQAPAIAGGDVVVLGRRHDG